MQKMEEPISVEEFTIDAVDAVVKYNVVKYSKEDCLNKLEKLCLKVNGYALSRPLYYDFLMDNCLINPEEVCSQIYKEDRYYLYLDSIITNIMNVNPILHVQNLCISEQGLILPSQDRPHNKPITMNPSWEFPSLGFKYAHSSFYKVEDIDFSSHFILCNNKDDVYMVVKNLDEKDVNCLLMIKQRFNSEIYKKYFCYYTIIDFYHFFATITDFSDKENLELIDEIYRTIIMCNPSPFIKKIGDEDITSTNMEESILIKNLIESGNFIPSQFFLTQAQNKTDTLEKVQEKQFSAVTKKDISKLAESISNRIFGQDEAVSAIVAAIKRAKVGFRKKETPILSAMFNGPSGSGKSELAKTIAEELIGDGNAFVRIDCSEYSNGFEVTRLIGSPPGFVGSEENGLLVKKVVQYPFSVILFDEIEKGHVKLHDLILQVLDSGKLTDSHGVMADFSNTIIILTSNIGSKDISKSFHKLGFGEDTNTNSDIKSAANNALKKHFKPEFIGRLDEIIYFNLLSKDACKKIAFKELFNLSKEASNINFVFNNNLIDFIVEKGYSKEYGARNILKVIKKDVFDVIADKILEDEDVGIESVEIFLNDDGKVSFKDIVTSNRV